MQQKVFKAYKIPVLLLAIGGALCILILLGKAVITPPTQNMQLQTATHVGRSAPHFALPILYPHVHTLLDNAQLFGRPYLLTVWASWCDSCSVESPDLNTLAQSLTIPMIGYNWRDKPDDAQHWLEEYGNPFTFVVSDSNGMYAMDWGVTGAPEHFLVDDHNIIRWKHSGPLTQRIISTEILPLLHKWHIQTRN